MTLAPPKPPGGPHPVVLPAVSATAGATGVVGLLTRLGVPQPAVGVTPLDLLRTTLRPLEHLPYLNNLALDPEMTQSLLDFLQEGASPPEPLLQALDEKADKIRSILGQPGEVARREEGGIIGMKPSPGSSPDKLEYVPDTFVERRRRALEIAQRLLDRSMELPPEPPPPALSLQYVFDHPEEFRDRELEIVLFDVDGTTRRGQLWLEWIFLDAVRFGPKNTVGNISYRKFLRALWIAVTRTIGELFGNKPKVDPVKARIALAALKGGDIQRVERSLDRFHKSFGRRRISPYMREEFARHRRRGRLLIGISASPRSLVQRHAEDMGIPVGNVFGSEFFVKDGRLTGDGVLLREERKPEWLRTHLIGPLTEKGVSFKIVKFYTDSRSDKPACRFTRGYGGTIVAVNAAQDEFRDLVLGEMGGMAVEEGRGERETVFYSSGGQTLTETVETESEPSTLVADLWPYGRKMGRSALAFAVGQVLSRSAVGGLTKDWSWVTDAALVASAQSALGGALAAGLGYFLTPTSGDVPAGRRWFLGEAVPLASAIYASSGSQGFSSTAFALSMIAVHSMIATGLTHWTGRGLRSLGGLLGWRRTEKLSDGLTTRVMSRVAQMSLYRLLLLSGKRAGLLDRLL